MNRPPLNPGIFLIALFITLFYIVSFAKVCPIRGTAANPECPGVMELPRRGYCRHCGRRLIWWWQPGTKDLKNR